MRFLTRCFLSLVFLFSLASFLFAYDCIVERIIDGDTLICSGEKVRLIGIDTSESTINPHIEKQRSLGDIQTILYSNLVF